MNNPHLNSRDEDFYLYEFLDSQPLLQRPRYAQHFIEIFNAAIEGAKAIANKYFANHYSKSDANEPTFDVTVVHLVPETQKAWDAVADFGLMAAQHDDSEGGLQLPEIICKVAGAYIQAALERIERVTDKLLLVIATDPDRGLANVTVYLDMFGQVVMAWIWLKQAMIAAQRITLQAEPGVDSDDDFYRGKLHAPRYFMHWTLPQTIQKAALLDVNDSTCFTIKHGSF